MNPRAVIVVPCRNRDEYLQLFLRRVPEYLEDANGIRDYRIVIAEQTDRGPYSAALAKNVGALYALSELGTAYLVFNDVDTLPVDGVDYRFQNVNCICFMNFGGCRIDAEDFRAVNGYNPLIAGWGYEDTDFYRRLHVFGMDYVRWERQDESRKAVVQDLELRMSSPEEELAHSAWYWRRDPYEEGPLFSSAPKGLRLFDRTEDWYTEGHKRKNVELVNGVYNLGVEQRLEYYRTHGCNLVDLASVRVEVCDKVVRVRYSSGVCRKVPRAYGTG